MEVVFLVDTSGSMRENQLRLVDPELRGLHYRGANITVIQCDTEVAKTHKYNPFQSLQDFHGRGGTDYYTQVIKQERGDKWYAQFLSNTPTVSPDGVDTLWLIPEGCMPADEFKKNIVPWGNIVVVPDETKTTAQVG